MNRRACVVIPGYNTAQTIGPLVRGVIRLGLDVVVVNDGSTDGTAQAATEAGALVISHLRNGGKGLALRSGFVFAVASGYDAVVTLDSDGQHDPAEIPKLLEAIERSDAGVVVGHRLAEPGAMPPSRRWTNRIMSLIVSGIARQPIPDSQCGFRAIRRQVLQAVVLSSRRFELETELLLAAATGGWPIASIPIRSIYDYQSSHIRPFRDGLRFLRLIVRYLLARPAVKRP